jgi:NAD(P)-dependent dehydrogenase (short-subunit alcohol dehydrogenase family)
MGQLEGRISIVTGAGQGIGAGIARRFAEEGATVVVAEINEEKGAQVASELEQAGARARFVHTDVRDKASVQGMVAATRSEFGRIDVLVNNAQTLTMIARIEHKTDEQFQTSLGSGLYGTLWAMQAVYPIMRDQGGGRIINLVSLNGVNAHKYSVDYNVAKEGIRTLSRTAAAEWGRHNILVNVIAPGAVTPASEAFERANPEMAQRIRAMIPLGKLGDPYADIAPAAVFLASEDSRYVTGNTLFVDGGGHVNGVPWDPGLPEEPLEL